MSVMDDARRLFATEGLAVPTIPPPLARRLERKSPWMFSTRELPESVYFMRSYVEELHASGIADYAVLCHDGHGINSYAVHYFLVYGPIRLLLQLPWGNVYEDKAAATATVNDCFAVCDRIVNAMQTRGAEDSAPLTVIVSGFDGLCWLSLPDGTCSRRGGRPEEAVRFVLGWLDAHAAP